MKQCRSQDGNILLLFLASCNKTDTAKIGLYAAKFERIYAEMNALIKPSWKPEKKLKKIFSYVHALYLKQYKLKADFYEIFESGTYNCVTASAFYALLFDKFDIPYQIKETPQHVFLVAFPETSIIKVETVDPVGGYYIPDEMYKKHYVQYLVEQKIIPESDINTKSNNELFDEYYYGKESINITELLALHYYNDAVVAYDEGKYDYTINQVEKALSVYDKGPFHYLGYSSLVNVVDKLTYENLPDAEYFRLLEKYIEAGINKSGIVYEFNRITVKHLINNGNEELYNNFYTTIISSLSDSALKSDISLIYYYEFGRHLYNKGQRESSHSYFRKALDLQPNNSNIQAAFVQSLAPYIEKMQKKEAVSEIEKIYSEYSGLDNNAIFLNLLLSSYLVAAQYEFAVGETNSGFNYMNRFEKLFSSNTEIEVESRLIGEVYSTAAVYYYKKGMKTKAKQVIEKGLSFAPHNYQLQYSLTSF